jgi:hypothetical protein
MSKLLPSLLVLLTACGADAMPPPPYHIYFHADADAALVRDAYESANDWNQALGGAFLLAHSPGERPPAGKCDVVLIGRSGRQATPTSVATAERDSCGVELRITLAARPTSLRHELGHALGLADGSGGIMDYTEGRTITEQNAADVRAYWNMEAQ